MDRERTFELTRRYLNAGKIETYERYGFDAVMGRREGIPVLGRVRRPIVDQLSLQRRRLQPWAPQPGGACRRAGFPRGSRHRKPSSPGAIPSRTRSSPRRHDQRRTARCGVRRVGRRGQRPRHQGHPGRDGTYRDRLGHRRLPRSHRPVPRGRRRRVPDTVRPEPTRLHAGCHQRRRCHGSRDRRRHGSRHPRAGTSNPGHADPRPRVLAHGAAALSRTGNEADPR